MFFHKSLFLEHDIDLDTAVYLTKLCNQFIDENSEPVTGEALQDGSVFNFSNKRQDIHTHHGLLLGLSMMGAEKPHASPVKLDRITKEDRERFQAKRIQQLEREVQQMRSKS